MCIYVKSVIQLLINQNDVVFDTFSKINFFEYYINFQNFIYIFEHQKQLIYQNDVIMDKFCKIKKLIFRRFKHSHKRTSKSILTDKPK